MKIIVCIKQVPDAQIETDKETGLLLRTCSGNKINQGCLVAIEAAIKIKECTGGEVIALTMGPPSAAAVLETALAMGADQGVLLTDKAFAGADVYATAYTLKQGIMALGDAQLIICGQQTTDGDTAQVPFSLAEQLGRGVVGFVKDINCETTLCNITSEVTGGTRSLSGEYPIVCATALDYATPRIPTLPQRLSAKKKSITILKIKDLEDKNKNNYGLTASPTKVKKVFAPIILEKDNVDFLSPSEAVNVIKEEIKCIF